MSCYIGKNKIKLFIGSKKVKKGYVGAVKVYSAGNVVTYHIDKNITYSEEVDSDATCLSPSTFTPSKAGWKFIGWREDTIASGNILSKKVMGDAPVNLYAVFQQAVSLSLYNNSASASMQNLTRYYNNGTVSNPTYKANQAARSGWTARGWSTSTAGNAAIAHANGATVTVSANMKLYGCYQAGVTLALYNNSASPTSYSLTRYYNSSGAIVNPTKAITQAGKSGWTARGFSTSNAAGAGITYANGATVTVSANMTLYGCYHKTITLSYNANGGTGSMAAQNGTLYYNSSGNQTPGITFTIANNAFSRPNYAFAAWSVNGGTYRQGQSITLHDNAAALAVWAVSSTPIASFGYTGSVQTWTAPYTGTYRLTVVGGCGYGNGGWVDNGYEGPSGAGEGGTSTGTKFLTAGTVLYIAVGGSPSAEASWIGGWNGGGTNTDGTGVARGHGGGGSTHIATTNRGVLANYDSFRNEILIVAGGGGGQGSYGSGSGTPGFGGGLTGMPFGEEWYWKRAAPGTQTFGGLGAIIDEDDHRVLTDWNGIGGTFGQGGRAWGTGGAGGGGWYGGGGIWMGNGAYENGGGGSGYIGGVDNGVTTAGTRWGEAISGHHGSASIHFISAG